MEFDMILHGYGKCSPKDSDYCLLLLVGRHAGIVDKRQHDSSGSNASCDRNNFPEMLFTPPSLALTAPDEWKIHEPITAKCGRADAILLLQCVHFQKATFGKNRISSLVVFIVYPFDIREPCLHCETEFVAP